MKHLTFILLILTLALPASAQNPWEAAEQPVPKEPPQELQFLAFFISQNVMTNVYASNDLLKGQTVGRMFGANTSITSTREAYYTEQRLLPFLIYQPRILNGKALLRASFEIDWTWGDASYGAGGNFGSAISADQVNLQTQNVELELIPRPGWAVNLGLQRMFDTPYNPYRTFFSTMTYTGYRLAYWGTDGVGISIRRDYDYSRWKLGYYQLYENNIQERDDVALWEAMYEKDLTPTWRQGLSLWYVHDRADGEGGPSILSQGLNSLLNDYNGTFRFRFGSNAYKADIGWLGTFWSRNPEFTLGRWMMTGFAVSNFGTVDVQQEDGSWDKGADIFGVGANLRAGYKYGQTAEDVATIDLIFTSGDEDGIRDDAYNGVITGNTWGAPGAIFISSGSYLLFPHGNVVNRYIAAITDISNMGYGLIGGTANFHKDLVPNKLSVKVGTAAAASQYKPDYGDSFIGFEVNGRISFQPKAFMNLELHAAYLSLGDYFKSPVVVTTNVTDAPATKPENPWTAFVVFKWLMF